MTEIVESNTAGITAASGIPGAAPCCTPYRRVEVIEDCTLYLADCTQLLPMLPYYDLILTDPPYGIGIAANPVRQKHEKMSWDCETPSQWFFGMMLEKAQSVIVWGGNYFSLPPSKNFLVWDKKQPEDFTLAMCEQAWSNINTPAKIFRHSVTNYSKEHPTQKPTELMAWCLSKAQEAKTVCDPFMGSGTTGVACARKGLVFTGIEREEKYFDIACERIAEAYRTRPRLFDAVQKAAPEQRGLF